MKKLILFTLISIWFSNALLGQLSEIVKKTERAVFAIYTYDEFGVPNGMGTGFFIDSKGTGITNYHVLDGASKAFIKLSDKTIYEIKDITNASKVFDLAKFKVEPNSVVDFLNFEFQLPNKGQDIFVIGNPEGLEGTVSEGIVSSIRDMEGYGSVIQITAPISPGSSGSPVMNMQGKVIGIATFVHKEGQNINFSVHSSKVNSLINKELVFAHEVKNKYIINKKSLQ